MARSARSYKQEADQLRARGHTYRQIASHWKERYSLNSRVALRLAHGLTQAEVAQLWNEQWPNSDNPKTAKQISYWEIWPGPAGRAPSLDTLNKLAFLYKCDAGELLDGQDYSHLDDARVTGVHGETLEHAVGVGTVTLADGQTISRVTHAIVDDFELLTDTFRQLDYREGSRRVRTDVNAHLQRIIETSNRTISLDVHQRLLRAAGDAAQLAAWLAMDAQNYPHARQCCGLAISFAEKASDRALHAYTLGVISWIQLHRGDARAALNVLETATDFAKHPSVPAVVNSWLHEATGEAYGFLGQPDRGLAALGRAERAFDGVSPENTPVWLTFFNANCHAARLKGRCLTKLQRPREAIRALYEALTLLPPNFVRERSGTLIDLAAAYAQMGQVEQACDAAQRAELLARQTTSERNRRRLHELLVDLLPWTNLDCVQSLYRQVLLN